MRVFEFRVEVSEHGFSGQCFKFQGSGFRVQSLSLKVELMVKDLGVAEVPRVQEKVTEDNAMDSTHVFG